ncbi:hybrid sensor histidine kinase/response regulator [Sesbania bispinosa]|nr:hybrid sensor histidine kinase/response regulator [Sesbania bispinosa]
MYHSGYETNNSGYETNTTSTMRRTTAAHQTAQTSLGLLCKLRVHIHHQRTGRALREEQRRSVNSTDEPQHSVNSKEELRALRQQKWRAEDSTISNAQ